MFGFWFLMLIKRKRNDFFSCFIFLMMIKSHYWHWVIKSYQITLYNQNLLSQIHSKNDGAKPSNNLKSTVCWQWSSLPTDYQQVERTAFFQVISNFDWWTEHSTSLLCQSWLFGWEMDGKVQWVLGICLYHL